jgi:NRPS condensation-like uncharacterized protein
MAVKRLFPASIVDEITYCVESAYSSLHLVYAWIFTLEGEVSTEVSQKALDQALNYYPKCKCILVNNYPSYKRWFRYRWEHTEFTGKDILQEIELSDPDFNIEEAVDYYVHNHVHHSIDLSSHIPLKVLLIRQPKRAFLFFIFHHAVADGVGSLSFMQKFINCYEEIFYQRGKVNNHGANFEAISVPDIRFRWNHFSLRRLRPYLRYCALFRKEPPVRLYSHEPAADSGEFVAGVRPIPPRQLEAIRTTARKYQATINDYLLATIFQTTKKWSREWIGQSERIYITVPMDLRSPEDRTMSNILSGANISLKPELIGDKEELLQLIREEMAVLTKNEIARTIVNLSCFLKPIPIPLRILMLKHSVPGFSPTLLLSNLGILSPNPSHKDEEGFHYLGSARICNIHCIPNAGGWPDLLVFTYNNQMVINMAVLSSCFSPEKAGRFMDSFVREITG